MSYLDGRLPSSSSRPAGRCMTCFGNSSAGACSCSGNSETIAEWTLEGKHVANSSSSKAINSTTSMTDEKMRARSLRPPGGATNRLPIPEPLISTRQPMRRSAGSAWFSNKPITNCASRSLIWMVRRRGGGGGGDCVCGRAYACCGWCCCWSFCWCCCGGAEGGGRSTLSSGATRWISGASGRESIVLLGAIMGSACSISGWIRISMVFSIEISSASPSAYTTVYLCVASSNLTT